MFEKLRKLKENISSTKFTAKELLDTFPEMKAEFALYLVELFNSADALLAIADEGKEAVRQLREAQKVIDYLMHTHDQGGTLPVTIEFEKLPTLCQIVREG